METEGNFVAKASVKKRKRLRWKKNRGRGKKKTEKNFYKGRERE